MLASPFREGAKEGVKEGVEEGIKAGAKTVILAGVGAVAGHIPGRAVVGVQERRISEACHDDSEETATHLDFTIASVCATKGADLDDWADCTIG